MSSNWSNVLMALAKITGGGAAGISQGIGQIDQRRARASAAQLEADKFGEMIAHNQAMQKLAQTQAESTNTYQSAQLEQQKQQTQAMLNRLEMEKTTLASTEERAANALERQKLNDFMDNLKGAGVVSLNPQQAYNEFNRPEPVNLAVGIQGGVKTHGMDPSVLGAINTAAGNIGNKPHMAIPNTEQYGGLVYQGHPFNPNTGANAWGGAALDAKEQFAYARMLSQMRAQVETAYRNAYQSYASNPAIAKLIASVDGVEAQRGRQAADAHARQQVQQAAMASLNALQSAFPTQAIGLTPEALMGTASLQTGGQAPQGANAPPQAGANPPPSPSLNFDPLGIRKGQAPPAAAPAGAAPPPRPPTAPDPNDPLGIRRRP